MNAPHNETHLAALAPEESQHAHSFPQPPNPCDKKPITVLLAEDHSLVRRGFQRMLDDDPAIRVVGEAADGMEAVLLARTLSPQVVVMDLSMPRLDGIQALKKIIGTQPDVAVLLLSMYSEEDSVRAALTAGARGYLLKSAVNVDLADAVKRVVTGERVITPGLVRATVEQGGKGSRLSRRERQVLELIAEGKSSKEIAGILQISACTVNAHRANLMGILDLHCVAELVHFAHQNGLARER